MNYKLLLIFCSLIFLNSLWSQEDLIKYTVQKGETVIGIAQKHKVTPSDLYRLNPRLLDGLKEGDVIDIPKSQVSQQTHQENLKPAVQPSGEIHHHTVSAGETKFGLSRRYGVSVDELERQNPHIITMLQTGHKLVIRGGKDNYPQQSRQTTQNITYSGSTTHFVEPRETLWGISRKYGLTVDELENANRSVLDGVLKAGQTLTIPVRDSRTGSSQPGDVYVVKPGETKYGLSKRFGLTIEELENLNPHIVPMLQSGHRLVISQSNAVASSSVPSFIQEEKQENPVVSLPKTSGEPAPETKSEIKLEQEQKPEPESVQPEVKETSDWVKYEVQSGETLFGLSRKTGLTIDELTAKNPELESGLKSGMVIMIPAVTGSVSEQPKNIQTQQKSVAKPELSSLIKSIDKVERKKLVLVIPFEGSEFNEEYKNKRESNPVLQKTMDFYAAALIAMDSIGKIGVNLDSEFAVAASSNKISDVTKKYDLKSANVIVTPIVDKGVLALASEFSKQNIPVITVNQESVSGVPQNLYQAIPDNIQFRESVLQYALNTSEKIIVIKDLSQEEPEYQWLEAYPQFEVVEAHINGTINENLLKNSLVNNGKNTVILNTDRAGVILNVTNILLKESASHNIQLASLKSKESFAGEGVSEMRFRVLKMVYPVLVSVPKTNSLSDFKKRFKKIYGIEASNDAVIGFDVTFDTLLRIFQSKSFEALAKDEITGQLQYIFEYQKYSGGGYHNAGVQLLQYDSDSDAKPVK